MYKIQTRLAKIVATAMPTFFIISSVLAEENIVKKETMSFERCLSVIETSKNKLSVNPEIQDQLNENRTAIFTLVDGYLTITCDKEENLITVLTNYN